MSSNGTAFIDAVTKTISERNAASLLPGLDLGPQPVGQPRDALVARGDEIEARDGGGIRGAGRRAVHRKAGRFHRLSA